MNFSAVLRSRCGKINSALEKLLPKKTGHAALLSGAMRYAVLGSGAKRVRPILALEACRAVGGREALVWPAACAIELIHSYSLVHDDLPSMDNDLLRRDKPSCHVKFGQAQAILAGDALLTLAFEQMARPLPGESSRQSQKRLEAVLLIAQAAGECGMVGGQSVDLCYQKKDPDLPTLEYIHTRKSGALIAVSARAGAFLGGGSKEQVQQLYRYGKVMGLLFQVVDDLLDGEGYAKILGIPSARAEAVRLGQLARKQLLPFGSKGRMLSRLADFLTDRAG